MKPRPSSVPLLRTLLAALLLLPVASLRAAIDLNSNGISDVWELLYEDATDPGGDADGDGQSNIEESIFGTNPMQAGDRFRTPALSFNAATGQLEVSWASVAGKRYQLQTCADLMAGEWLDDGEAVVGAGETVSVSRIPGSLSKMYLRVQVSDVDTDGDSVSNWEEITIGLDPNDRSNGTGNGNAGGPPPPPADSNVVTVRATSTFASEDGLANGRVTFNRSGDTNPLMVGYSVSGTATKGLDHTAVNAWFALPANENNKVLDVNVRADSLLESSESVTVTITWILSLQPGGSTSVLPGSPNRATVIISNSTTATGTGLLGQYYDTSNTTYANGANFDQAQLKVTRVDPTVDFTWLQGTPNANTQLASTDDYSVVWEGYLSPTTAGTYNFQLDADDKARVLLDTGGGLVQIAEHGWDGPATVGTFKQSGNIAITAPGMAGARYPIRVEFVETTGDARCRLQWRLGNAAYANIPSTNVFTTNNGAVNEWNASYFNSPDFTGLPATQTDTAVTNGNNGVWGAGTPDVAQIHRDTFSVRWSGQVQPQFSEDYTFVVNCDDSAKLWINGQQLTLLRADTNAVIDWPTSTTVDRYARVSLLAGVRYDIRLDYFENTSSAKCQLSWYSPSQPKQIIPSNRLYPASAPQQGAQLASPSTAFGLVGGPFSHVIAGTNGATVSITGKPTWLTFSGGVLSGTPPAGAGGDYQIVITTTSAAGTGTSVLNLHVDDNTATPIKREFWTNVTGATVADTVAHIQTGALPDDAVDLTSLEAPTDFGDDYGARIRGYISAPTTGNYYFWIAANNAAELWISNDDEPINAFKRASVATGSATPRTWNAETSQKSPWLALEAGRKYYVEILHKAGVGAGDNLAIGWLKPGQTGSVPSEVVPGSALSVYVPPVPGSSTGTLYVATLLAQGGAMTNGVGTSTMTVFEDANPPYATIQFSYHGMTGQLMTHHIHADAYLTKPQGEIVFDFDQPETTGGELLSQSHTYDPTPGGSGGSGNGSFKWTFQEPQGNYSKAEMLEMIRQGKSYINLHTPSYPLGEIRGNYTLAAGSRTFTPPPPPPDWTTEPLAGPTNAGAAARFLTQATFGPNIADIQALQAMASYEAWIDDQFDKPTSLHLPEVLRTEQSSVNGGAFADALTFNTWWWRSITGEDQLRQRIAFALSEIHVVSAAGPLVNNARALSYFYDKLADHAFGNFRQILQNTTLTPAMGRYLDMLRNDKPDLISGRIPNENYAREIKQLFSVGLFRMWPDGTLVLNSQSAPIETYNQQEIVGFAHVFTGWDYGYDGAARTSLNAAADWTRQMREVPPRHFTGPKRVLNNEVLPGLATVGGQPLDPYATHSSTQYNDPAYQALPAQELQISHDQLFAHPNVGPFICRQLIQRLVTSHPSRDYLFRVVSKFNDDGTPQHERGNMRAVIKAILLDYEARSLVEVGKLAYGKQREPVLRVAAAARAFRSNGWTGNYVQNGTRTITITTDAPHGYSATSNQFLDFTSGNPAPWIGSYSTGVTNATTLTATANGWATSTTTNGYLIPANSTTCTVTMSNHWLQTGHKVFVDFTSGGADGVPGLDGQVYTLTAASAQTGTNGTFVFEIPLAQAAPGARNGNCIIPRFSPGSYSSGSSGMSEPVSRRVTMDTNFNHDLAVGDEVQINFTAAPGGNSVPVDMVATVDTVVDLNTWTFLASSAGTNLGANVSDAGVYQFPLKSLPLNRAGTVTSRPSTFAVGNTSLTLDQTPLNSPTVFNFFLPDFKFPGALASQGITTPEFQETAETSVVRQANYLYEGLYYPTNQNSFSSFALGNNALVMHFSQWMAADAANLGLGEPPDSTLPWTHNQNIDELINQMSTLLVGGQLPPAIKTIIRNFVALPISSISTGNPSCTVTTAVPHDYVTGDVVLISGVTNGSFGSSLNSSTTTRVVTVTGDSTFTVPVSCSSVPTPGGLANAHVSHISYNQGSTNPGDPNKRDRLRTIIHLILTSPDFTIQR